MSDNYVTDAAQVSGKQQERSAETPFWRGNPAIATVH